MNNNKVYTVYGINSSISVIKAASCKVRQIVLTKNSNAFKTDKLNQTIITVLEVAKYTKYMSIRIYWNNIYNFLFISIQLYKGNTQIQFKNKLITIC